MRQVLLLSLLVVAFAQRPNKRAGSRAREADSVPVVGGGLDISPELIRKNPKGGLTIVPDSGDVLLQTNVTIPENFFFFSDSDFGMGNRLKNRGTMFCATFFKDEGQGDCNSCWAYSVTRVMSLKACLSNFRTSGDSTNYNLSPMSMICKLALATRSAKTLAGKGAKIVDLGEDGCQARSIQDALEYLEGHALPRSSTGSDRTILPRIGGRYVDRAGDECDLMAKEWLFTPMGITMFGTKSRALRGRASMQREIMANGPIVIIMRLTQEFVDFTGSLFNPTTFSYIDREGRKLPEGTRVDEDDWNNHFMVAVGWAVSPDGVPAWIVLNSWGAIYEPGEYTKRVMAIDRGEGKEKTAALMIAMAVDGSRKMEISNRYAYSIATPKMTDLRESYYQVVPSSVEPLSLEKEREYSRIGAQKDLNGNLKWNLPEPLVLDKISNAIAEREMFKRLVILGIQPNMEKDTKVVQSICLAYQEFGCPAFNEFSSIAFYSAKKWIDKMADSILKEEKERRDKVGLLLTDEEKEEIQSQKQEFLTEIREGKTPNLEGNDKWPLVKNLCISFYSEGCPKYPLIGSEFDAHWTAKYWLQAKIEKMLKSKRK